MTIVQSFTTLGQWFFDLVFPVSCLVCGRDDTYLCDDCLAKLPRLQNQICVACYKLAPYGKTHPDCRTKNTVDGAIAAVSYKDRNVHKIIEIFKYSFISDLAKPLSQLMVQTLDQQGLSDYFADSIIVPIPLHQRRLNWRGFNQSELLSTALSERLNVPIQTDLIRRKKYTQPQVNLKAQERKKNIADAFELTRNVSDQKILLVDDLVTSGATANEVAKLLKKNKVTEVWIISAAHG